MNITEKELEIVCGNACDTLLYFDPFFDLEDFRKKVWSILQKNTGIKKEELEKNLYINNYIEDWFYNM